MSKYLIQFLSQIFKNIVSSLDDFSSFVQKIGYEDLVDYIRSSLFDSIYLIFSSEENVYLPDCTAAGCTYGKAIQLPSDVIIFSPTLTSVIEECLSNFIESIGYIPSTYFTEIVKIDNVIELKYHPQIFRLWSLQIFLETVIIHELTHSALFKLFNTYCASEASPELYAILWNAYRTKNLVYAILKLFKNIDVLCTSKYIAEICEEIPRAVRSLLDVSYLLGLTQEKCMCEVFRKIRTIKLTHDLVIEYVSRRIYTYKFNGIELVKY